MNENVNEMAQLVFGINVYMWCLVVGNQTKHRPNVECCVASEVESS